MALFRALILIFVIECGQHNTFGQSISDVKRLKKQLFELNEYDTAVRPVKDQKKAIQVYLQMCLSNIVNFDIPQAKLETTGLMLAYWRDENISWNSSDYGGIWRLDVELDEIWNPHLTVLDTVTEMGHGNTVSTVSVTPDGGVSFIVAGTFHTFCDLNMRKYPRDSHTCSTVFLSHRYASREVHLIPYSNEVDISNLRENGAWTVTQTSTSQRIFKIYDLSMTTDMMYNSLVLTRRPDFLVIHKGIPLLIIAVSILCSHLIPLTSPERMSYSVTLLLAFIFWQAMMVSELPDISSTISMLSLVKLLLMVMNMITVVSSVALCRLAKRTDNKIPYALVKLTEMCSRKAPKCQTQGMLLYPSETIVNSGHDLMANDANAARTVSAKSEPGNYQADSTADAITWLNVANAIDSMIWVVFLLTSAVSATVFFIMAWLL